MADEIRADMLKDLWQAAKTNNAAADKYRADADQMQAKVNEMRARAGYFTAMADRWTRIAAFIENGTFDLDYLLSGDDLDEARKTNEAARDVETTDAATEAFVDVADAERYALRDEYVNSADGDADAESGMTVENMRSIFDPHEGMTNADVMSAEELDEYERDGEAYLDAVAEAEAAEHADDYQPGDEHDYEPDDEDEDDDVPEALGSAF